MPPFATIDTVVLLVSTTILHPFPALLTLLSVVALGHRIDSTAFLISAVYFGTVALAYLLLRFDKQLAAGVPRAIDWENQVVVVTGGAGGLGSLLAETCGMRGVPVAALDVKDLSKDEQDEREEKGIRYYRCDVGDRGQVQSVAHLIEQDLGVPTILINNAAVVHGKQILDLTEQDIDRTYRTNLLSHYHTIQTFLPGMLLRPNGGTIVTVSSVLGYLGCAGLADYTSSKAALKALHTSLRAELAALALDPPTAATQFPNTLAPRGPPPQAGTTPPKIYPSAVRLVLISPGQVSTPLFSFVAPPSKFFGPPVSVAELAAETMRIVDAGVHAEVEMPLYARWIEVMGVLPAGLRGMVRRWAGLDRAGWQGCKTIAVKKGTDVGSGKKDD